MALVYTPSLTDRELKKIELPISETISKYKTDTAGKIKGINPLAVEAIDGLKPYGDGDGEFSVLLWRLHALNNIDKHRTLFTFGPEFVFTADRFPVVYHVKTDNPNLAGSVRMGKRTSSWEFMKRSARRRLEGLKRCFRRSMSLSKWSTL